MLKRLALILALCCTAWTHGDGVSIPVPAGAAAWGLTKLEANFTFTNLNSVDVNNSGNCTYSWFTQVAWPTGSFAGDTPTPPGNISLNSNGMGLLVSTNGDNVSLQSIYGPGGTSWCGYVLDGTKKAYIEFNAAINIGLSSGNPHTTLWMLPLTNFTTGTNPFVEDDIFEGVSSAETTNLHQWTNGGITASLTSVCEIALTQVSDLNLHAYGRLIVPAALNSGTGLRQLYIDNVHQTGADLTYSATGPPNACSDNNANGTFSSADTQYNIILGGPIISLNYVRVWVAP